MPLYNYPSIGNARTIIFILLLSFKTKYTSIDISNLWLFVSWYIKASQINELWKFYQTELSYSFYLFSRTKCLCGIVLNITNYLKQYKLIFTQVKPRQNWFELCKHFFLGRLLIHVPVKMERKIRKRTLILISLFFPLVPVIIIVCFHLLKIIHLQAFHSHYSRWNHCVPYSWQK